MRFSDVRACSAGRGAAPPPPADLQLKCDAGGLFFQWRAVKKAQHYRYRLVADGERLINSRTKNTSIHLGAGDPGQEYTARVRVKRKGKLSKWSSVKTQCPAAAPIPSHTATPFPAPLVEVTITNIGRDRANIEWNWKRLPASTVEVVFIMRPEVYEDFCAGMNDGIWPPRSEGKEKRYYVHMCPDTSYYWAFMIAHKSGIVETLKEGLFRTLP